MCGIFAYVGRRTAQPLLVEGLRRLEYRGYDSAGVATVHARRMHVRKCAGRVVDLGRQLQQEPAPGRQGIGHTRWATHGPATPANAHPHVGGDGLVAVAHNGVIENHAPLRRRLQVDGVMFRSDTDTEVIAHLIARYLDGDLVAATRRVIDELEGSYAFVVQSPRQPGLLVGACAGAPLVVGVGLDEHFMASDAGALAGVADRAIYLQDGQVCAIRADRCAVLADGNGPIRVRARPLAAAAAATDSGSFPHYMLKEIFEQPDVLARTLDGRLDGRDPLPELGDAGIDLSLVRRLLVTGCGTSYHAGLIGKYVIERLARVPVDIEYASEFRYRGAPLDPTALVLAVSQSGETADTLAALCEARDRGCPTVAVCNVPDSTVGRTAAAVVPLNAGPEIGVASTKAFTCQVGVLTLLACALARARGSARGTEAAAELAGVPDAVRSALHSRQAVRRAAERYHRADNFLYLGRQYLYPVALEGALKLKEISYIHAEGYPAAEMKHGPLALIDEDTPSVILCSPGPVFAKVLSNLEEVRARNGPVIAVACHGQEEAIAADEVVAVPAVADYLQPLVTAVPLQLLAYEIALLRGCDVDRPRNLAKSVTVE